MLIDQLLATLADRPGRDHDRARGLGLKLGGGRELARVWRDPQAPVRGDQALARLLVRAQGVRSWGHPADAADLFFDEAYGDAFRVAAVERLYRIARDAERTTEQRRLAAEELYLGYRALLRSLPAAATPFR